MGDQVDSFFEVEAVSKAFRPPVTNPLKPAARVQALRSVSLSIPRGSVTCLVGPNGAGKTTLIKILASLVSPDSGRVLHRGVPVERQTKELAAKIGLVTPTERSFYWRLSGRENLLFYGRLFNHRGAALRDRVDQVLRTVGMTDAADAQFHTYSAGMKQKINIARTLLGDPALFLLDEPASHLDPIAREEFRTFVRDELVGRRGATVFLCTHDLNEAQEMGDRLVVLDRGRVVAEGTRRQLLDQGGALKTLLVEFAGTAPTPWVAQTGAQPVADRSDRLRVTFDPEKTPQEDLITSFVLAGGRLREARREGDGLLEFIKRKTGSDA